MLWYEKIKERREALGLSQADLAKRVSLSQAGINKIENGRVLRTRFLPRIAKALDINISELDPDYSDWRTKSAVVNEVQQINQIQSYGLYYASDKQVDTKDGDTPLHAITGREDGTILTFEKPIGRVFRPPYLMGENVVIAFLLQTDQMYPELKHGDIVFVIVEEYGREIGGTYIFISKKYALPEARIGRICRVTQVFDESWNTSQWKPVKGDVHTELMFASEWKVSFRVVAKYYAAFDMRSAGEIFVSNILTD